MTTGQHLFHLYSAVLQSVGLRSQSKFTQLGMMEQPAKSSCLQLSSTCSMGANWLLGEEIKASHLAPSCSYPSGPQALEGKGNDPFFSCFPELEASTLPD